METTKRVLLIIWLFSYIFLIDVHNVCPDNSVGKKKKCLGWLLVQKGECHVVLCVGENSGIDLHWLRKSELMINFNYNIHYFIIIIFGTIINFYTFFMDPI